MIGAIIDSVSEAMIIGTDYIEPTQLFLSVRKLTIFRELLKYKRRSRSCSIWIGS